MKFAFMIMDDFDREKDRAEIAAGMAQIIGVRNIEEACDEAKKLYADGVMCIEVCGAFKEADVRKLIDATENKIPIGYVVHLPEQDEIYKKVFS